MSDATEAADPRSARATRASLIWLALTLGVLCVGLAPFDLIATNDGPHHLASAVALHRYDDVASRARECFAPNTPPTGRGAHEALRVALVFFEPLTAARVVGCFAAALLGAAAAFFVSCARRRLDGLAPVAALTAFASSIALGFVPYTLASGLALGAAGLWLRAERPGLTTLAALAALAFFSARCHVVGAGAVYAALCLATLVQAPRTLPRLLVALTPAALVALSSTGASVTGAWHFTLASPRELCTSLLPVHPAFGGSLLVGVVGCGLAGLRTGAQRGAACACLGLLALTFVMPQHLGDWQFGGRRLLVAACAFGLAAAPAIRWRALEGVVVAFAVCVAAAFGLEARRAHDDVAPVIEQIREAQAAPLVRVGGQRFHQWRAFEDTTQPLMGFAALVAVLHGGASLHGHQNRPMMHSVLLRCGVTTMPYGIDLAPVHTPRPLRLGDPTTAQYLTLASLAEAVAFLGQPEDGHFLERVAGFTTEYQGRNLYLGRAPRCSVRVAFENVRAPLDVAFGYLAAAMPMRRFRLPPGGAGGTVAGIPCGPMWIRLSPGAVCDDPGALRFTTSPSAPQALVRCALR